MSMRLIPADFLIIKNIFESVQLHCQNIQLDPESREYGALTFTLNNHVVKFRTAKITPTKVGQFVTLWKRIGTGPIMPYDTTDSIDFFMVTARSQNDFGFFVFPKIVLQTKDIISKQGKGGKRATRIYPTWDRTDSKQAQATQKWQLPYFVSVESHGPADSKMLEKLTTIFG